MKRHVAFATAVSLTGLLIGTASRTAQADDPPAASASAAPVGRNGAQVTKWADNLAGPQGLVFDARSNSVFVVENGAGRITRFDRAGGKRHVFATGLSGPAFALRYFDVLMVGERTGNTVAVVDAKGQVSRLSGEVKDPLGIASYKGLPGGGALVLSHRSSLVLHFRGSAAAAPRVSGPPQVFATPEAGTQYGWRDLAAAPDGTLYVTDELKNVVLRRRVGATVFETWAAGLSSPSGLAFSPNGRDLYVTEEGSGRVSRLTAEGRRAEVIAEGMGKARDVVFLDSRTLLVSDRAGTIVWKVTLPASTGQSAGK